MVDKSPFDPQSNPDDQSEDASSLDDRAAKAARAELRGERTGILGAVGPAPLPHLMQQRRVPKRWSWIHVMERMEEAFRTLRRVRMRIDPSGFFNSMPRYEHDRSDLNAQAETHELENLARSRNRARILPSPDEITRMQEALCWPTEYLSDTEYHHLARAVNLSAMWAANDADVDKALRRIKTTRRAFNARKVQGLRIIARQLIRERVPIR
jgi:hypothetical protein